MAQYKTGTVSVTNGSATVTGSGTLWSGEIAAGDLFTIVGDNAWYEVASVGSNTSITLSANYAGTTGSGKSYAISRDFTTRLALPYPQKGDIETASIIKRAFEQIDTETNIATANYSATSAPTANDDSGDGYSIGSWWVNVTSDEAYLCVDATVGAAVWTKISVDVPSEIVALLAGQSVSMASLTLSGGTANGVLYLNGSKVATSGSALTFDGTNLGVGATPTSYNSSADNLVLYSTLNTGLTVASGTSNDGSIFFARGTSGADAYRGYIQYYHASDNFAFGVNGSEAMRLTSTGLGIGTSSPATRLHINGADGTSGLFIQKAGTAQSFFGAESTWLGTGTSNNTVVNAYGANSLMLATNGIERARITSSGDLLVGTTSDGAGIGFPNRLAVDGGASEASIFKTSAGTSAYCSRMWNSATSGNNLFIDFQTEAGGTDRGSIAYNRAGGLVAYNTTSDYRAKDISGPIVDSGVLIDSVPVYMGKMKGATQERPMFIAHETPAYAHTGEKDAVDSEGNPVYQQMDASALIPVMWAEIQSLRARVAALES